MQRKWFLPKREDKQKDRQTDRESVCVCVCLCVKGKYTRPKTEEREGGGSERAK